MRLLLIFSVILFSGIDFLAGQDKADSVKTRNIIAGVNLFSIYPFPYTLNDADLINIEPTIKIPVDKAKFYWVTTIGYTYFNKNTLYNNLNYKLQGGYIKTGFETNKQSIFISGMKVCIARFVEYGSFFFEGNYFDDYRLPFPDRLNTIVYFEPYVSIKIPFWNRLSLEPRIYMDLLFQENYNEIPTHYVPGFGYRDNLEYIFLNFDLKLLFRL